MSIGAQQSTGFAAYCRELAETGRRDEALSLSNSRLLPPIFAALALPLLYGITTVLQANLPAPWPWLVGAVLLLSLVAVPPLMAAYARGKWQRERPLLLAHIRERVFGLQQLQHYLEGQRSASGRERDVALSRENIQRFIDFYVDSSTLGGRGYYFLGRLQSNRALLRALLQQLLAEELAGGFAAFDELSDEELAAPAVEAVIERRGWLPPSREMLHALLNHLHTIEEGTLRSGGLLLGAVIGASLGIGVYIAMFASFLPGAWPAAGAITLLSTWALARVLAQTKRARWEHFKDRRWAEIEWDIFHNGLLRDFVHQRRGSASRPPGALIGSLFAPIGMRYRPLPPGNEELGAFAQHYLKLDRLNSANDRPTSEDLTLLRILLLEITARGLLRMLDEAPQEFERW